MSYFRRLPRLLLTYSRTAGLAAALLAGLGLSPAQAQPLARDPVDALQQALRAPDTLKGRKEVLEKRAAAVRSIGDLARAMLLLDWRDESPDAELAAVDRTVREQMAKRFREAVGAIIDGNDPIAQMAVARGIGESAVAARNLGTRDLFARDLLAGFAPGLAKLSDSADASVQAAAARALGLIRPDPEVAVPALEKLLRTAPDVLPRRAAATALTNIIEILPRGERRPEKDAADRGGVDLLRSLLRRDVVDAGKLIVPAASVGLADSDAEVRQLSAEAITQTAGVLSEANLIPEPAAPELPVSGRELTPEERRSVESYRGQVEAEYKSLLPLLEVFGAAAPRLARVSASDPNPAVGVAALKALEEIGYARQRLNRRLLSVPEPPSPPPAPTGTEGSSFVRAEQKVSDNRDPLLPALRKALPDLAADLSAPNTWVRLAAVDALEMQGADAAPAAPALVRALEDRNRFVRWAAARVLGRMGPVAEVDAAVAGLARLLYDTDLNVRLAAELALERWGPRAAAAVPDLTHWVSHGDPEGREGAIRALERIGEAAQPAIPAIAAELGNADVRVRRAAAAVLGRFGPDARAAVPALRRALDDSDEEVRRRASEALLNILAPPKQ
jgi:hypothetical protein